MVVDLSVQLDALDAGAEADRCGLIASRASTIRGTSSRLVLVSTVRPLNRSASPQFDKDLPVGHAIRHASAEVKLLALPPQPP